MKELFSTPDTQSALAATQSIAVRLTRLLGTGELDTDSLPPVVRLQARLPERDPLDWLQAQPEWTQYYWSGRDQLFTMAGVGEAEVLIPIEKTSLDALFDHMRSQLSPKFPNLRYYGGFRFHPGTVKGKRWKKFQEYRFVIPQFEVFKQGEATFFACNLTLPPLQEREAVLDRLLNDLARLTFPESIEEPEAPVIVRREDVPTRDGWKNLVSDTLDAIQDDAFDKVVLARESCFTAAGAIDSIALLRRIARRTESSFDFCFHPVHDRAFIGASPERLYYRNNCAIQTEALAGTRPRGHTDVADKAFAEELLVSEKEQREHRYVVDMLVRNLQPWCQEMNVPDTPKLMALRNCQHLHSPIEGLLHEKNMDAKLIAALHPTPAVGGAPRTAALRWIDAHEPFDRGIFAAPVGWVGYDAAEFCVAIRSALVQGNELAIYTGAGIVEGSDPASEWDEIENKMSALAGALSYEE